MKAHSSPHLIGKGQWNTACPEENKIPPEWLSEIPSNEILDDDPDITDAFVVEGKTVHGKYSDIQSASRGDPEHAIGQSQYISNNTTSKLHSLPKHYLTNGNQGFKTKYFWVHPLWSQHSLSRYTFTPFVKPPFIRYPVIHNPSFNFG